ncbi:MAG TPA: recombination mediator RecR [Acidobacteriota bacterium]|nr:recombination mediator RecR [Acidobacteriota bacterium]
MDYLLAYYPEPLARALEEMMKLPGIGIKSAQRIAFAILKMPEPEYRALVESLSHLQEQIRYCSVCWNFTSTDPCKICSDPRRDEDIICVVEEPTTLIAIEKTREFSGRYHVLLGCLNPLAGIGPEDIKVKELLARLQQKRAKEVILATNPTVEGEATAVYISRLIHDSCDKVTRIALGVPVGGELDYVDEVTMARAITGRSGTRIKND